MSEFFVGGFVQSNAGHDLGKCYVIFYIESEYVYLVDGRIRTISRPKRKKIKHICGLAQPDPCLTAKIMDKTVRDADIKRAIKLLPIVYSSKEVM